MKLAEWIQGLESDTAATRQAAAEALAQLGEDARPASVALVSACADGDETVREWVAAALEGMGPPETSDTTALAKLLSASTGDVVYWAATLLGRLHAGAAAAIAPLAAVVAGHQELAARQRAAWALGQIGPPASAALDVLRSAASNADPRLSRLAREAIEQIQA